VLFWVGRLRVRVRSHAGPGPARLARALDAARGCAANTVRGPRAVGTSGPRPATHGLVAGGLGGDPEWTGPGRPSRVEFGLSGHRHTVLQIAPSARRSGVCRAANVPSGRARPGPTRPSRVKFGFGGRCPTGLRAAAGADRIGGSEGLSTRILSDLSIASDAHRALRLHECECESARPSRVGFGLGDRRPAGLRAAAGHASKSWSPHGPSHGVQPRPPLDPYPLLRPGVCGSGHCSQERVCIMMGLRRR